MNGQSLSMTDVSKICGKLWSSMSDEVKKPYHEFAIEDKARFEKQT